MHKSSSNDGTKSGLICLGLSGSEVPLLVELGSTIGATSFGGKRRDEAGDEWKTTSQNRSRLGANLTKFALQECGAANDVNFEQTLNGRQFEYAGFAGSGICWVLDESNASSSHTFDETHKRDEEQLVADEQLGVFPGSQASNAIQVKDGTNWSGRFPLGGGNDGINDFPKASCAPSFTWGTAQNPVNNLAAYEIEVHQKVERITGIVFLILANNVNGNEAKEEATDPAQSIDEVWNVSCTAMSGIEMQYVEHGLENGTWDGVREGWQSFFE